VLDISLVKGNMTSMSLSTGYLNTRVIKDYVAFKKIAKDFPEIDQMLREGEIRINRFNSDEKSVVEVR
jgi:hypothetical protein